jgi:hypothetical protein
MLKLLCKCETKETVETEASWARCGLMRVSMYKCCGDYEVLIVWLRLGPSKNLWQKSRSHVRVPGGEELLPGAKVALNCK